MSIVTTIKIFGDSVLKGSVLEQSNNKYTSIEDAGFQSLQQDFPLQIDNKSGYGFTVENGHRLLQRFLGKGMSCDAVLLEFGGNDCNYDWAALAANPDAEHLPRTTLARFEKLYRSMISDLKKRGIVPVLMSLPPIDAEKYFAFFTSLGNLNREKILGWLGDVQMIARYQELYSNTVTRIAYETGSMLIDVRSKFLEKHNYKQLMCEDGIHPNHEGHQVIRSVFREFAQRNLPITS